MGDFPVMGVPDAGDTAWMLASSCGGGWHQLVMQAIGAFTVLFYSFFMVLIIAFIVKLIFGLRATSEDEELGIDEAEHAETAYDFANVGPSSALSMAGAGKEA